MMEQVLYQLPDGWKWQTFDNLFSTKGYSVGKVKNSEVIESGMVPVVDQSQSFISGYSDRIDLSYAGKLPVLIYGDHTNCVKYIDFKFICGADGTKVLNINADLEPKFAFYLISKFKPETQGYRRHFSILKKIIFPIPPKCKQKSIVEKLDAIILRVDTAILHLQESVKLADELSNSGLAEIFGGLKERYEVVPLSSVVKINSGIALPKIFKNGFSDGNIPFFKVAQMNNHHENMISPEITFNEEVAKEHKIKLFPKGSTLIPKRGGAILTNKKRVLLEDASYDSNIMGLKAEQSKISDEYLFAFMRTIDLANFVDASTIPQVNNKHIDQMHIPLISLDKQTDVVNQVNQLVQKIEAMNSEIYSQLNKLFSLKSSILDSAFKGGL